MSDLTRRDVVKLGAAAAAAGTLGFPAVVRAQGKDVVMLRCKKKDAMKHPMDFADIVATGSTPLPAEYSSCKDIGTL